LRWTKISIRARVQRPDGRRNRPPKLDKILCRRGDSEGPLEAGRSRRAHRGDGGRGIAQARLYPFTNLLDYLPAHAAGDWTRFTRDQGVALREATIDVIVGADGERSIQCIKFKLADKRAALVDLGLPGHQAGARAWRPVEVDFPEDALDRKR
jgi:hypothetical protein